ncbi:subtilisin-like protease SBT5.3 [Pyrus ussuriensis x Pyrus communis]|uniref:Subtilisin-like protease SBT5.3 n=1 Tax=Pyrus ussuriensis x Pyrus communis TaxID=2448454 RepID=A0A5N5G5P9_9ROSA|nr:subtilisin-like protease SBT5.3 [Pyrus ussuriensis x Pyrus communis]
MRPPTTALCLLSFLFSSLVLHTPTFAIKKSYVVYLGSHSHPPNLLELELNQVTDNHYEFLGSFLGSHEAAKESLFYSYTRHINGFAATLEEEEAAQIAKHPKVVSLFLNQGRKLHTTRSWDFLGLEQEGVVPPNSIWKKARYGEDSIIGNLDTGAWPESKSFSDEGYGPIPSKWKGICQNQTDPKFHCNRKLIGARYFNKGFAAVAGPLNSSFNSPRDNDGHGSHTLSTAGGNFVTGASVFGFGNGTAKGGSPKSRVAAYKVCWPPMGGGGCFDADILAAFDVAIDDGVDVLSVSLGGNPTTFFNDSVSIGAFHAVKRGIVVVCSAGNSGPAEGTVSNISPWQITVGASTMDREFPSYVTLGNWKHFKPHHLKNLQNPRNEGKRLLVYCGEAKNQCLRGDYVIYILQNYSNPSGFSTNSSFPNTTNPNKTIRSNKECGCVGVGETECGCGGRQIGFFFFFFFFFGICGGGRRSTLKLFSSPIFLNFNSFGSTETDIPSGFWIRALYVPGEPTFFTVLVTSREPEILGTVIEG